MGRSPGIVFWVLGVGALSTALNSPQCARAEILQPIPLECRIAKGSWQACQMDVIQPGHHWFLQVGSERFEFIHHGSGRVRMGNNGVWTEVTPRWAEDQSLCWGPVCARGEIPLD